MRRSAAPSQLGAAQKRARFTSPVLGGRADSARSTRDILKLIQEPASGSDTNKGPKPLQQQRENHSETLGVALPDTCWNSVEAIPHEVNDDHPVTMSREEGNDAWTGSSVSNHNLGGQNNILQDTKPVSKSFQVPCMSRSATRKGANSFRSPVLSQKTSVSNCQIPNTNTCNQGNLNNEEGPITKYYNVMWCKLSKKKHKKWEGDAILVTKGRSLYLLDTDGKEIGKGSGYKTKELQSLDEGNTLAIGGKEIEVMSLLSEKDFKCGKCFTTGACKQPDIDQPTPIKLMNAGVSKPFNKPLKADHELPVQPPAVLKPRHDPDAHGALVMPKPSPSHQFEHNKGKLQVVDVVVDPYICQHLRPHQRTGVVFLYECVMGMKNFIGQGAILADEMGLGKTLQCISLIWTLLKQGPYGGKSVAKKVLIITPGSLVKNWLREFKKWLGTERLKVYAVSQDNKVKDFVDSPMYPVLIVSYEMFVRTVDVISTVNFDLIICDEGHRLKNTNIKTTSLVSSLPCRRRIVLTGTPVQNDLQELYSIVDFCNPGILGTTSAFRHVYEGAIVASRQPGASTEDHALGLTRATELNRITAMFILRRTSDINNKYLPPKVELVLFCRPRPLQHSLYTRIISSRVLRSCLVSYDSALHLMCISALRKLCNHPSLLYDKATAAVREKEQKEDNELQLYCGLYEVYPSGYDPCIETTQDSGKLSVLAELLKSFYKTSPRERVVLVSNYTQTLDTLERLCTSRGYQSLRLDGQTPTGKRQQLVERFNGQYCQDFIFLLSSKAGGTGLNLVGASRLILYDIDWNPANDLQAMARVWRDGQRRTTYIYRLLTTGTIEEKMYQRQVSKQALSGVVVDAKGTKSNQVQFSPEELRDLFILRDATDCSTHDTLGCTCLQESSEDQGHCVTRIAEATSVRPCQIGKHDSTIKKNLCMDELFQWQHKAGPNPQIDIDPVLCDTNLEDVSFVFCCQSNAIDQTGQSN